MTSESEPEDHPQNQPEQTESFAETILKDIDLSSLPDERSRECVRQLLNLVEALTGDLRKAQAENQYLREQLKRDQDGPGGPGKGNRNAVNPGGNRKKAKSSEQERGEPREWKKRTKLDRVRVDREQKVDVDQETLPADAEFKGYEEVGVQDLQIRTDNVKFLKAKYYCLLHRRKRPIWRHCRRAIGVSLGRECGRLAWCSATPAT